MFYSEFVAKKITFSRSVRLYFANFAMLKMLLLNSCDITNKMKPIYFAPLQGYTDDVYRRVHYKLVGGVEYYYTPFVRFEAGGIRSKDVRDIAPENNAGTPVVPQLIFAGRKDFEYLVSRVEELGYKEIDLNMGCPFPLQAKHGKGCGILARPDVVADVLEGVKAHSNISFSVKMRLGWDDISEATNIIKLLNSTNLQHVTLHPRTGAQQYKGSVDVDAFAQLHKECVHPMIYNGDLCTLDDIYRIEEKFPGLKGIMLGRGLLARPSLATEYSEGAAWDNSRSIALMLKLHRALMVEYSRILKGDTQMLSKMRTFWEYAEPLLGRKPYKKIMKSGNLKNYLAAVDELRFL